MKKSTINFTLDGLMFISMAAIAGIGFLIKYTLLTGQESWVVYGDKVDLYFLGMDRHEWGTIHLIIGFVLLGLVALHVILHWKLIVCLYDRIFQGKLVKRTISIVFLAICALFIIVPFLIKPDVIKVEHGRGRQSTIDNVRTNQDGNKSGIHKNKKFQNGKNGKRRMNKQH
jgi:glucan phosphoethanolaminetransferase (alkaline phosphatase superfamily)